MKFRDALRLAQAPTPEGASKFTFDLVCGFTPDHFRTFLTAHFRDDKPDRKVEGRVGLFGDLVGNLERLAAQGTADAVVVAVEWSDLDDRLGLRRLGGWAPASLGDVVATVEAKWARIAAAIEKLAATTIVAVSTPTLPPPPISYMPPHQAGLFEARLRAATAEAGVRIAGIDRARLLDASALDRVSPVAGRLDVRSELNYGYPYQAGHASELARLLVRLVDPPAPKKGLITDLDDTFWRGILGEVGIENVSWDLDHHTQIHGLYQQMLKSLADAGVLIAVASKNDAARVEQAFLREDLFFKSAQIFPFEVNWGPKSASVASILNAWNVGPDSVVFIDDSPLELAEVSAAHPAVTTIRFPKDDAEAYGVIERLRELFGKPALSADDAVRLESLRRGAEVRSGLESADPESFLSSLDAALTVSFAVGPENKRALELINKTNQFNLNGRRISEPEWLARLNDPDAFAATVNYTDKFGPLGTVAVVAGRRRGGSVVVEHWVMSCRAFSRRIEHATASLLLKRFAAEELSVDYAETSKNGPLREYLESYLTPGQTLGSGTTFARSHLETIHPALYHRVEETDHA